MTREISQRELRNESGAVMAALTAGQRFVVTSNGVPVGELRPVRRATFVGAQDVVEMFRGAPAVDLDRLRSDLDAGVDQGLPGA